MFCRQINDSIALCLSIPQYADELFKLTDRNRGFLGNWLPWLGSINKAEDTRAFLILQLERFAHGEAVHQTIFHKGRIAGVVAFNSIDHVSGIGQIGYWLGAEFTGKGIMTASVKDMIFQGFEIWDLQRLEIYCAMENRKSRAVAERLEFSCQQPDPTADKVVPGFSSRVIYSLTRQAVPSSHSLSTHKYF